MNKYYGVGGLEGVEELERVPPLKSSIAKDSDRRPSDYRCSNGDASIYEAIEVQSQGQHGVREEEEGMEGGEWENGGMEGRQEEERQERRMGKWENGTKGDGRKGETER